MSKRRPSVDIATKNNQPLDAVPDGKPREMLWDITASRVVYSCSQCSWQLVAGLDTCLEPLRFFNQHTCAEYPRDKLAEGLHGECSPS